MREHCHLRTLVVPLRRTGVFHQNLVFLNFTCERGVGRILYCIGYHGGLWRIALRWMFLGVYRSSKSTAHMLCIGLEDGRRAMSERSLISTSS